MLKLENIKGGYAKGSLVLQGIDMEVAPGEVVGIIGTNGCGKSTLGKAIMNLVPFRYGQVYFDSENVSNLQAHELNGKGISMLMQGGRIFRNMSVFEHLKLVSGLKNETNVSVRIEDIAKSIGITKFISSISLKSRGGYLSGGEKQILKLMMALMNNPKCLILDEISAGMSPANLEIISETVRKIKEQKSISIILIEQNIRLAQQLSDRILLLERGVIDREFKLDDKFNMDILHNNIFN